MAIKLIVGLGNHTKEYEQTRHNAGFWFVDNLLLKLAAPSLKNENKFFAKVSRTSAFGHDVWLMEPQTFMNASGKAVGPFANFYKINPEEILVVHDEMDLGLGVAKLKKGGSTGGHRGLNDIIKAIGSQDCWRLRIGIDHPRNINPHMKVIDYVLQRPTDEEQNKINEALLRSLDIVDLLFEGKFEIAMNQLHTKK